MSRAAEPRIRTAVAGDLPELQRVYRAASLSNEGDAPLLLASPEFLVFAGDGIAEGLTRVMVGTVDGRVLGFATVVTDEHGELELEDLFVDPVHQRRGIARVLVGDAVARARAAGHAALSVTANRTRPRSTGPSASSRWSRWRQSWGRARGCGSTPAVSHDGRGR